MDEMRKEKKEMSNLECERDDEPSSDSYKKKKFLAKKI
jgi:hypothetical protein